MVTCFKIRTELAAPILGLDCSLRFPIYKVSLAHPKAILQIGNNKDQICRQGPWLPGLSLRCEAQMAVILPLSRRDKTYLLRCYELLP
jgi:hypothetical protein